MFHNKSQYYIFWILRYKTGPIGCVSQLRIESRPSYVGRSHMRPILTNADFDNHIFRDHKTHGGAPMGPMGPVGPMRPMGPNYCNHSASKSKSCIKILISCRVFEGRCHKVLIFTIEHASRQSGRSHHHSHGPLARP